MTLFNVSSIPLYVCGLSRRACSFLPYGTSHAVRTHGRAIRIRILDTMTKQILKIRSLFELSPATLRSFFEKLCRMGNLLVVAVQHWQNMQYRYFPLLVSLSSINYTPFSCQHNSINKPKSQLEFVRHWHMCIGTIRLHDVRCWYGLVG